MRISRHGLTLFGAIFVALALVLTAGCGPDDEASDQDGCLLDGEGPQDEFVYVGNTNSRDITVINPRTCETVDTIDVDVATTEGNASPDGRWVFMTSSTDHVVVVIDTETNEVARIIDEVETRPVHSFFSPDHQKLWVGNDHSASVSVIDVDTLEVEHTITVGEGHRKMAITDGDPYKVYVSNIVDSTISVINSGTMSVEATIDVNMGPHGMDYASTSKKIYNCGGGDSPGIEVIATEGEGADTVVDFIELPQRCGYLHIAPGGEQGWATMKSANSIAVFDATADELVTIIEVNDAPDKLGFFVDDLVLVSHVGSPDVAFIDMNTLEVVDNVTAGEAYVDPETGRGHRFIMSSLGGDFAYVPNSDDDTLTIIDVRERAVRGHVAVGDNPMPMGVGGPTGGVYYPR